MAEKDLEKENLEGEAVQNEAVEEQNENVESQEAEKSAEETSEDKIQKLEAELQEWKNSYTRKLAEFQNFTKRKEMEVAEMKKFASEGIILKVLENIDNLERAENASTETKNFDALVEGVNMILRNLKYMLSEEGIEEIEADRKAPIEKEEIVETVQKQNDSSYNTAFENVTTQLARDMLDLGLKILISTIIPGAFN